jgi:pimeloyl-ACP methyl ester carboxylesterase
MKTIAIALGLLALSYVLMAAGIAVRQREFIYHPHLTRVAPAQTDFALDRGDVRLRGWRVNPGQRDAIIYFGGNAEAIQSMAPRLATWFPGHTVYLLAYRGYGASEGRPSEAALTSDAVALHDAVRSAHPAGKVTLIGRSLGSGVASHVASARPVDALVLVTPFDSLATVAQSHMRWLPVAGLLRDRFDAARDLAGYRGRTLIIRANLDEVVPAASTQALIDALPVAPSVVELRGASHNTIDLDERFGEALRQFVR